MSDVSSGAVLTLVVPLSLLVVVIALAALSLRRKARRRDVGAQAEPSGDA